MPAKSPIPSLSYKALLVCLFLVPLASASGAGKDDWQFEDTRDEVREFVSGGSLHVHLGVGDLRVTRGDANKIRLHYTVKSHSERNVKEATADIDIHSNTADIEFRAPGGNTEFDVDLEVPQQTNLDLHDKVGDITIDNVEGDKDIELNVGDIRVTADQKSFRLVHASTNIGDVNSGGFGEADGWLGKTLRYHGDGKYELRAHVLVGDINLEGK
jgi:hypothetical protein